jgi:death on curing protein
MSRTWAHPTPSLVRAIHQAVIESHGGSFGIRDEALMESAIAAPQATMFGEPLMSDGIEIAAAYLFYLCKNHPFVDGNKRVAAAVCLTFLERNGLLYHAALPAGDWEALVLDVAASKLDRERTTERLRALVRS